MKPKVSIIVPNYNHATFLPQRISSILNQTYTDFELILLDDCSTDDSKEILLSYQTNPKVTAIKLNEQNTGSPFVQWENGIKIAQGEYIWIAESDDYADSHFLEYTVNAMENCPEATICLTGSFLVNMEGDFCQQDYDFWQATNETRLFESHDYLMHNMLNFNSVYNASMVLFRREESLTISDEYKKMRYCGDWLFWIELIQKGNVIEIRRKLNYFRQHSHNTTKEGASNGSAMLETSLIKKYFYQNIAMRWKEKVISQSHYYREIKHLSVSKKRRKEIYNDANKHIKITYWTYILGKIIKKYSKCFCQKKEDAQLCEKLL